MANLFALPLNQSAPWYEFQATLEAATYTFEIYFNTRAQRWRMSIRDSGGRALLVGIPLLIRRDLTGPYHYLGIPPGALFAIDDTGDRTEPTLSSFLIDHTLYYLEA